jgi:hypothetical protein
LRTARLGDKDQTLKFLEQAYGERTPWLIMIRNEPIFDLVHSDPRYQVLVGKSACRRNNGQIALFLILITSLATGTSQPIN